MSQMEPAQRLGSARLLSMMGVAWLVLAAGLLIYQLSRPATIQIEWDTATEIDSAGFYIYRSQAPGGDFIAINQELIPSKGDALTGATYSYVDEDVVPGETYYYILEEVEFDSSANRYDEEMFSYRVPQTWWVNVVSAVSALVGLALLISGQREGK